MCIYLGDDPNLTYKKQEHVFPAGLGGIAKLPHGVVSDKANEEFSKLEDILMHQSLISTDRMFFGPGVRGTHNPKETSKSYVSVAKEPNGDPILCYLSMGKPYIIPQFCKKEKEIKVSFPNDLASAQKANTEFANALQCFKDKFVYLKSKDVPCNIVLIGYWNKKYYVASSEERPHLQEVKNIISLFLNAFSPSNMQESSNQVKINYSMVESSETARVYGKVAMNVLAHLKGEAYVRSQNFDEIRRWIISGENDKNYNFLPSGMDEEDPVLKDFPPQSHWCVFLQIEGEVCAMVCFYGHWVRKFTMGKVVSPNDFFTLEWFICDWKNQKEYTTNQYIEAVVKSFEHNELSHFNF